jgi:hypothetical protein
MAEFRIEGQNQACRRKLALQDSLTHKDIPRAHAN